LATKGDFAEEGVFAKRATLTWKAMFMYGNFPKEGNFAMLEDFNGVGNFTTKGYFVEDDCLAKVVPVEEGNFTKVGNFAKEMTLPRRGACATNGVLT
jgi:hypothetical protein